MSLCQALARNIPVDVHQTNDFVTLYVYQ